MRESIPDNLKLEVSIILLGLFLILICAIISTFWEVKMKRYIIFFTMFLLILLSAFFLFGCMSSPKQKDFKNEYAYYQACCMYYNQKNPDKSACSGWIDIIKDQEVEKRYYKKLKFCMGTDKPDNWSQETCRYYLNQK